MPKKELFRKTLTELLKNLVKSVISQVRKKEIKKSLAMCALVEPYMNKAQNRIWFWRNS